MEELMHGKQGSKKMQDPGELIIPDFGSNTIKKFREYIVYKFIVAYHWEWPVTSLEYNYNNQRIQL